MKTQLWKLAVAVIVLIVMVGSTGSLYARAQDQVSPGGDDGAQTSPNGTTGTEKGPVQDQGGIPGGDPANPGYADPGVDPAREALRGAGSTRWYTVAGSGFMPYTNSLTWTYGGAGCLAPSVSGYWRANVNLPDGAVLKYIYFGYYNSAASTTSTAYLYRYYYSGTATDIVDLLSTPGSSSVGYHFVYKSIASVVVDNYVNAYMFSWSGSATQQLCYMQVGYELPTAFGVGLPLLVKP